jgi:hypothetical protein
MGTKLGSVYVDVKGNKGDRGIEERIRSLSLLFQARFNPVSAPVCHSGLHQNTYFCQLVALYFTIIRYDPRLTCIWHNRARKKYANSTRWFEDSQKNVLLKVHGSLPKITLQKSSHSGDWKGDLMGPRWAGWSSGNERGFPFPTFHV